MLLLTIVAGVPAIPVAVQAVSDAGSSPITESVLLMLAGAVVGAATITAVVLLFFINAMSNIRKMIYERDKTLRLFASRHNREDDDRFDILVLREWQTACRVAHLEGVSAPPLETFPRRAYLDDEDALSDVKAAGIAPLAGPR